MCLAFRAFLWLLAATKQALKKAHDDRPKRAERERRCGDGYRFRCGLLDHRLVHWLICVLGLRLVGDFQLLSHTRRKLPEHLPRYFFNHATSKLNDLPNQIDISVD